MTTNLSELGKRIRKERKRRQFTLKEFSKLTSLSASFLSQIERGNTEPSITSLKKIANQFGFSVINLFRIVNDSEENWSFPNSLSNNLTTKVKYIKKLSVVRHNKRKKISLPGSNVIYDLLTPDMNRQLEVMHMKVSPGENSGEEPMLDAPGEKLCFVMKGSLEVTVGREVYKLEAGDSLYYPAHVPHSWYALKGEIIKVIWILTPPSF